MSRGYDIETSEIVEHDLPSRARLKQLERNYYTLENSLKLSIDTTQRLRFLDFFKEFLTQLTSANEQNLSDLISIHGDQLKEFLRFSRISYPNEFDDLLYELILFSLNTRDDENHEISFTDPENTYEKIFVLLQTLAAGIAFEKYKRRHSQILLLEAVQAVVALCNIPFYIAYAIVEMLNEPNQNDETFAKFLKKEIPASLKELLNSFRKKH